MNEKVLYMIRHGSLINSHEGVLNGQSDTPLSEEGLMETLVWKEILKNKRIDLVLSSDLARTYVPAVEYSKIIKCEHKAFKELREIDAGKWELKKVEDLLKNDKENFLKRTKDPVNVPFPDGENLLQMKKRVKNCIDTFLNDFNLRNILYIGHAGVIRVLVLTYLGLPLKSFYKLEIDYGSLTILRFFDDGNVTMKLFNVSFRMNI